MLRVARTLPIDNVRLSFDPFVFADEFAQLAADADAAARTRDVQVCVTGTFQSARYGKIEISESDLDSMIANFNQHYPIPPTELSTDYDHLSLDPKQHGDGRASGWYRKLFKKRAAAGKVELWGTIEWTPIAAQAIKNKEYRFFSPTFVKQHVTNLGKKIGATLLGGALTNRPFLQGMAAVTLSQSGEVASSSTGRSSMGKTIRVKDAQGNDVDIELSDVIAHTDVKSALTPAPGAGATVVDPNIKALTDQMSALTGVVTTLSTAMSDDRKTRNKERAEARVLDLIKAGKLAPKDKATWISMAESNFDMFTALSATLQTVIKLRHNHGGDGGGSQSAGAGDGGDGGGDEGQLPEAGPAAIKLFEDRIDAARAKDAKLSYDSAIQMVAAADPKLAKLYQESYRQA
jgi:hypothetical protein